MRDRHQAAAAIPAKIRYPSVVGPCIRLRQFHILQFGFVGKAEGRVDQRRVEAFLVEALDALLRVHRAERIQLPVGHSCREIMIAIDRSHSRESAETLATLESRRTPPDFDVLDTLLVAAQTERLWLVFLLDVVFP